MAWLEPIPKPRCGLCQALASYHIMGRGGAKIGSYCTRHAKARMKSIEKQERVDAFTQRVRGSSGEVAF